MLRMYVPIQSYIPSGHHTETFREVGGSHSGGFFYLHLPTFQKYYVIFPKCHKQITK